MGQIDIYPLAEKPEYSQTCAAWSFGSWGCLQDDGSLDKSLSNSQERANNTDKIPLTWIGIVNKKIAGMVSLVANDHSDHPELSPWLASMFVHPEFRKKGYASQLIQRLHIEAKNLGYTKLYLFTPDADKLYEKNGWKVIGQVRDPMGLREFESLMEIEL